MITVLGALPAVGIIAALVDTSLLRRKPSGPGAGRLAAQNPN
jgi:hypothetical protein